MSKEKLYFCSRAAETGHQVTARHRPLATLPLPPRSARPSNRRPPLFSARQATTWCSRTGHSSPCPTRLPGAPHRRRKAELLVPDPMTWCCPAAPWGLPTLRGQAFLILPPVQAHSAPSWALCLVLPRRPSCCWFSSRAPTPSGSGRTHPSRLLLTLPDPALPRSPLL